MPGFEIKINPDGENCGDCLCIDYRGDYPYCNCFNKQLTDYDCEDIPRCKECLDAEEAHTENAKKCACGRVLEPIYLCRVCDNGERITF